MCAVQRCIHTWVKEQKRGKTNSNKNEHKKKPIAHDQNKGKMSFFSPFIAGNKQASSKTSSEIYCKDKKKHMETQITSILKWANGECANGDRHIHKEKERERQSKMHMNDSNFKRGKN